MVKSLLIFEVSVLRFNIIALIFLTSCGASAADKCLKWFQNSKIKPSTHCILECATIPVDMGTFTCHTRCDEFCKLPLKPAFVFRLSNIYPGLTPKERALAASYPSKMLMAYRLTFDAQFLCSQIYHVSETNDESDACRHFVWAALLTKELGKDFTEQVLDAHEQEPTQPEEERAMDLANNRRGISKAETLIKNNRFNDNILLEVFKEELRKGNLVVLKKASGRKK